MYGYNNIGDCDEVQEFDKNVESIVRGSKCLIFCQVLRVFSIMESQILVYVNHASKFV